MECQKENHCSVKSSYIESEIVNSIKTIVDKHNGAIQCVKIYLLIVFGAFGYFGFLNTKILAATPSPHEGLEFFAWFGVALIIVSFVLGWILLDYLTNAIYVTIVQKKHIGYMRKLKSIKIGEKFTNNCIFPLGTKTIEFQRSRQLPEVVPKIRTVS